jgi:hypothetical protein
MIAIEIIGGLIGAAVIMAALGFSIGLLIAMAVDKEHE